MPSLKMKPSRAPCNQDALAPLIDCRRATQQLLRRHHVSCRVTLKCAASLNSIMRHSHPQAPSADCVPSCSKCTQLPQDTWPPISHLLLRVSYLCFQLAQRRANSRPNPATGDVMEHCVRRIRIGVYSSDEIRANITNLSHKT